MKTKLKTTTTTRATKPKELTKLLRPKARYGDFIPGQESKTGNSVSRQKKKITKIAREIRWEAEAEAEALVELEHDIHVHEREGSGVSDDDERKRNRVSERASLIKCR